MLYGRCVPYESYTACNELSPRMRLVFTVAFTEVSVCDVSGLDYLVFLGLL